MAQEVAYTWLGAALSLGLVSLVGLGGLNAWYLWEANNRDTSTTHYGASAICQESPPSGDPNKVGLDLALAQDAGKNTVDLTGTAYVTGAKGGLQKVVLKLSRQDCPSPSNFIATKSLSGSGMDSFAAVSWTVDGANLQPPAGNADTLLGGSVIVQTASGASLGCCTITALPGATTTGTSS